MATITLPVFSPHFRELFYLREFEIDKLSFTRSITRQGTGARAAWRRQFASFPEVPQSHEVLKWNEEREAARKTQGFNPLYSIRRSHRNWLPVEEQVPVQVEIDVTQTAHMLIPEAYWEPGYIQDALSRHPQLANDPQLSVMGMNVHAYSEGEWLTANGANVTWHTDPGELGGEPVQVRHIQIHPAPIEPMIPDIPAGSPLILNEDSDTPAPGADDE